MAMCRGKWVDQHAFSELRDLCFRVKLNVRFGAGMVGELAPALKESSWEQVLITTDPGLRDSGVIDPILEKLNENGIEVTVFDRVEPNPKDTTAEAVRDLGIQNRVKAIVGIGGGSSLDTAKAAAMLISNEGVVESYDGMDKVEHDPIPIVAVPTTAGTGSEVTANAAISNSKTKYKMSIRSPKLIPTLSILDPELLQSIPPFVCATSSIDALTHAVEGYLSNRSTTFTDQVALFAARILSANIRPFYANPSHPDYAANMLYGSMLAGFVVSNTGTGNAHALARALGGEFDAAHGHACAIFLPRVLRFNSISRPEKFLALAEAMGLQKDGRRPSTPREAAGMVVGEVEQLLDDLQVPKYLESLDIPSESLDRLAEPALANSGPNPRKSSRADMVALLRESYSRASHGNRSCKEDAR